MEKVCRRCKEVKQHSDFSPDSRRLDGLQSYCRACDGEEHKKRYADLGTDDKKTYIEKQKEPARNRREERKRLGLCSNCDNQAVAGKTRCVDCAKVAVERTRESSEKRELRGLCYRCGKTAPELGKKFCTDCLLAGTSRLLRLRAERLSRCLCEKCGEPQKPDCSYCDVCHKKVLGSQKKLRDTARDEVITAYGGKCACPPCGLSNRAFLSLDHVNNDGAAHRRSLYGNRKGATIALYRWAKRNGFPKTLQLLCFNCNMGKARNGGACPHLTQRGETK